MQSTSAPRNANADLRYLLVRRAERKNYYDLSRKAQFLEPLAEEIIKQYQPRVSTTGFDIITDSTVRYSVYQVWKVRVIETSDTDKRPTSTRDSAYVLRYPRNPDWVFCAKRYNVSANATRTLVYTDFQDGREYAIDLTKWTRPWQVFEVEILNPNALTEIWQLSKSSWEHQH